MLEIYYFISFFIFNGEPHIMPKDWRAAFIQNLVVPKRWDKKVATDQMKKKARLDVDIANETINSRDMVLSI